MKDTFTIEITKKDKIYLSIILTLVCAIIVMAICLPRPYKEIEKEVPVYETRYREVYDTKEVYIISEANSLFDSENNCYQDIKGNKYISSFSNSYIETGDIVEAKVSIMVEEAGVNQKKELILQKSLLDLFVSSSLQQFKTDVNIDYFFMSGIKNLFISELGNENVDVLEDYLFELTFENAKINLIVSYISE